MRSNLHLMKSRGGLHFTAARFAVWALMGLAWAGNCFAQDWPQFLGPTRNGVYPGTNLANAWPKEGPPIVWQRKVGQGFSGPVIGSGKLILFHRLDDKETVECLDARSGKVLWSAGYPTAFTDDIRGEDEGPRATPAIADGRVYTFGAEGMLSAWGLATGKMLWSVATKARFNARKGFFGMACSPLVEGNAVLVNIGGSGGAGIVAFDKVSGKVVWQASNAEASYSSPVVATMNGQRRAFFFTRNGLTALDPASGKIDFEFPWRPAISASVNAATPLVIDDTVFISTSYGRGAVLLRVKGSEAEKVWAADDVLSNHYSTSVHHHGFLYGFDGRQEQGCNLRCVELKTGKVRWSQNRFGAGTIILVNGDLLVLSEKGELLRAPATPEGFQPVSRAQVLPFEARAYPALAKGYLYARSKSQLVCVDLNKQ